MRNWVQFSMKLILNKNGENMIKNIVFDLGNVILKESPNIVLNQIKMDKKQYESIHRGG